MRRVRHEISESGKGCVCYDGFDLGMECAENDRFASTETRAPQSDAIGVYFGSGPELINHFPHVVSLHPRVDDIAWCARRLAKSAMVIEIDGVTGSSE